MEQLKKDSGIRAPWQMEKPQKTYSVLQVTSTPARLNSKSRVVKELCATQTVQRIQGSGLKECSTAKES